MTIHALRRRAGKLAVVGACAVLLTSPGVASATTYQVNTNTDHAADVCAQPPAGDCTIRDAMNVGLTSQDIIRVPAGTYQLTVGELVLANGTLQGAGARSTVIRAAPNNRVLQAGTEAIAGISGVTLTGGNAPAAAPGGGIFVNTAALLVVVDSAVVGNQAPQGGGIWTQGRGLVVNRTTVSGNTATGGLGGGIGVDAAPTATGSVPASLTNSTVSGNTATGGRANAGGGILTDGALTLDHSTIANNRVAFGAATVAGGGLYQSSGVAGGATPTTTVRDSIIAGNTGGACSGNATIIAAWTGDHNLDDDGSCGFSAFGDKPGVNPLLGALANNGGPTNTHALASSSPAVNAAASCPSTDQRGVARPQLGVCDIGAYEYRAPHLTVLDRVVNDQGGTQSPGNFRVHVRRNSADVGGSPKPGSASGTTYALTPGTYVVGEDADSRYTAAITGSCAASGAVTLAEGQAKTCTITNSDKPPVVGKIINAEPAGGTVKVKPRGRKHFHTLVEGEQLPSGTIIDTRKGRVGLTAAANKSGGLAQADFYDGLFKLTQSRGKRPLTTLTLIEKLSCKGTGKASIAKKKKKKRRLWGDGHGKFRTKGQFSSATVRGTKWLVQDTCTTTLTRVARGKVAVRDFVKHKTKLVKAGHRYVAHKRT